MASSTRTDAVETGRSSSESAGIPEVIAAVDLGSNSFHMIVGELRHGQLAIIDRLKETVRLSEGLEQNRDLTAAAKERALDCLARFGERLQSIRASNVRAAGTSTFRRAKDSSAFCRQAEQALGHPIEVISGREEARLIFNGVVNSTPPFDGFRLVLDIGGGSTELILGQGMQPQALESLHMGCVVMTERHFKNGDITRAAFEEARLAIRLKLLPIKRFFRNSTDVETIGASGTVRSTERVARELGIIDDALTQDAVETLIERVLDFKNVSDLSLPGLSTSRAQVWPGGLAILAEVLRALRVEKVKTSDGALREGLLYDYLGRKQDEDARERSVSALASRYNVDTDQADRVAETAVALLGLCRKPWRLESELYENMLEWSARLHEIGLDVSHEGFQKHGAYIAGNADLPGFPRNEQDLLAFLISSQRRQMDMTLHETLPPSWQRSALRLAILLRLAVLLRRSRSRRRMLNLKLEPEKRGLKIQFPSGWLDDNPLTVADLSREAAYLESVGYTLEFT